MRYNKSKLVSIRIGFGVIAAFYLNICKRIRSPFSEFIVIFLKIRFWEAAADIIDDKAEPGIPDSAGTRKLTVTSIAESEG